MARTHATPVAPADVPCKACSTPIPHARSVIAFTEGLCVDCKAPRLETNKLALAPEYETAVWERGGKL